MAHGSHPYNSPRGWGPSTPRDSRAPTRLSSPDPHGLSGTFRLHDLAPELQILIFQYLEDLSPAELASAALVSHSWNARLTPALYASVSVSKANRERLFVGLGIDFLSASALESRSAEAGGSAAYVSRPNRKAEMLGHVRRLSVVDQAGALALAEALLAHDQLFPVLDEVTLAAPVFRHLVNSGLAAFGRPRSGSAFVGETLVAHLRPKHLRIDYPHSRSGAGVFDPVLLARVLAVLLIDWAPESVEYHGVGSDFPPVLGPISRIHCTPCSPCSANRWDDPDTGCASHGALVRMHLRRVFGLHARDELLEAIAEGADPTDDDDLDPDALPESTFSKIEYYGVPCIAAMDRDAFLDRTFAHWPVESDVGEQVSFFA